MEISMREHGTIIRGVIFWGTLSFLYFSVIFSFGLSFLISYILYCLAGGFIHQKVLFMTIRRDLTGLYRLIQIRLFMWKCSSKNATVGSVFEELTLKHPNKSCFLYEDQKWSFREVNEFSNKVANCFSELGFRRGDDVALLMESRPEYVGIWLGLSKIGVVPGLINTNLRLQPLAHSITVVDCKAIIFSTELLEAVKDLAPFLKDHPNIQYFCYGDFDPTNFHAKALHLLVQESSPHLPSNLSKGNYDDRLFYVYTSGTTGLPKAAIIRHSRFMWIGTGMKCMFKVTDDDILYTALPLYHTAGGIIGMSFAVLFGCTIAIRKKFSASCFWDDCVKYQATVSQYIGEICRYLMAQPVRPSEKQHKIRFMFGNGLRPQIWKTFVERFRIKDIGELYGSTEGNANVVNIDNTVGAIGFMSRLIPTIYPVSLIKVDPLTGEPFRGKNGLCIRCEPGEIGEFVGKIIHNDPVRSFDGYVSRSATKKKIVRDVFRKGDMAFLSGDLLVMDEYGYLFFVDRTGDTFRWKGENVSTAEVEAVISNIIGLHDSVVYGVEVPGTEGRAGMVAIQDSDNSVDLSAFLKNARKSLPVYSIPIFVRIITSDLETTGTYKLKKINLQKEAINPTEIKDDLYILSSKDNNYIKFTPELYNKIVEGEIKL